MTAFLLIRHAHHEKVGKGIAGRTPGLGLSREGERQAEDLAEQLAGLRVDRIYSSPLERTRATALAIAKRLDLEVRIHQELVEVEFGAWEGCAFDDLDDAPGWRRFNEFRSGSCPPGGEFLLQVQARMIAALERLRRQFPRETIALVGHGDPIKAAIACYAGIPLDFMLRIEISPASISIVLLEEWGPRILCVNHAGRVPGALTAFMSQGNALQL